MEKIKIVLVEDDDVDRKLLNLILNNSNKVEIVHNFMTGPDFLNYYSERIIDFDVAVIDYRMPILSGLDTYRSMFAKNRYIKMLMVSNQFHNHLMTELAMMGSQYYCPKKGELIADVLPLVMEGKPIYKSKAERSDWLSLSPNFDTKISDENKKIAQLSPLHKSIISLIAEGKNSVEIGDILGYETSSIEKYRTVILRELQLKNTHVLITFAMSNGLISPTGLFCKGINNLPKETPTPPKRVKKKNKKPVSKPSLTSKKPNNDFPNGNSDDSFLRMGL
ncbi:MAG: response regulator transcription factor [Bacteroidia bacterium]|nr:response regulator transcription factor [Bacteroidia bacterium]